MELKVDLPFQQLIALVRRLTPSQKAVLQAELSNNTPDQKSDEDFIAYLLNGPVYSNEDIQTIEGNHKSIAAWRKEN